MTNNTSSKKKKSDIQADTTKTEKRVSKVIESVTEISETAEKSTEKKIRKKAITQPIIVEQSTQKINTLTIVFRLKFHTEFGQNIFITGNHPLLGNGDIDHALPLHFLNDDFWTTEIELNKETLSQSVITYNYVLKSADGVISYDWGTDKTIEIAAIEASELCLFDSWNFAGYYENVFYSEPFVNVLLNNNYAELNLKQPEKFTHVFKVKAPLLQKQQTICLIGSGKLLKNWSVENPILLQRKKGEDYYSVKLNLTSDNLPIFYKYGVYDIESKQFIRYEDGNNRFLFDTIEENKQTFVNDGFAFLPNNTWKGTGVAIPVFSVRTNNGFGTGEFLDLKLLVDWSKKVGLKLIQILPINDTTATHTWKDSYPYAAISAFALHPLYLNLEEMTDEKNRHLLIELENEKNRLNSLFTIDYDTIINIKLNYVKQIYPLQKEATFNSKIYQQYFNQNKHWLVPYAIFCWLRDKYHTANFNQWPEYTTINETQLSILASENSADFNDIAINYFIQFHLHLQLKAATQYAHENGIIVKGDIAIGVYRFGVDAWQRPDLFHMNMQAGAPPDDFAVKGQNWGFPTYNWQAMRADGFAWWKLRFEQMSYYFDAFRIDHILGFFRIWSIPMHAVEGIMGHFVPSVPVHISEFDSNHIWFDYHRYTQPFITNDILWKIFGYDDVYVKTTFLNYDGYGNYTLKPEVATQQNIMQHLASWNNDAFTQKIKQGLFDLVSNIILFEVEGSQGQQYHFRFGMDTTYSFKALEESTQTKLNQLYINYFFRRQDDFWMKEALQKLPALKRVTNMLVCGEDLGLVPSCVPEVMRQLGLLSLEIQRMPKDPTKEFFHPNDAPYLSVVTPSTHDMSTIRGWWEEDTAKTQAFYNRELGQWGNAPFYCEAWINNAIVVQHLYSPAMWCIFQLQDLLGTNEKLRRINPADERINIPANPNHYWCYRMHITVENLLEEDNFNSQLKEDIIASGR